MNSYRVAKKMILEYAPSIVRISPVVLLTGNRLEIFFGNCFMDKYEELKKCGTHGVNYGLSTEDILAKFREWDEVCEFNLSGIETDRVMVDFQTLPEDLDSFVRDIYDFCPDTGDQGFGCIEEMMELAEDMDEDIPEDMEELVEGLDFEDEDCGIELLKRSLKRDMRIHLWWD